MNARFDYRCWPTAFAALCLLAASAVRADLDGEDAIAPAIPPPEEISAGAETPIEAGRAREGEPLAGSIEYRGADVKVQGTWAKIKSLLFGDDPPPP